MDEDPVPLKQRICLGLFSADDLLKYTGGGFTSILNYYGYDYKGNVLTTQPTLDDFFHAKDANGNYSRLQGAFMPTYAAGYIQDKFFYKDLGFVIGLRVDRYDANQMVLKDQYSLYDTKKAGDADVKTKFGNAPGNIGTFTGFQIVKKYLEKYPETTLPELIKKDANEIYSKSKYKPKA